LTSIVAVFVLVVTLLFAQQALKDPTTLTAVLASWGMVIAALVLNRAGAQVAAAWLLVLGMDGPVEGALVAAPGGLGTAWTPSLDLFVISLIAAGFIISRRYIPLIVVLHSAMILGDFYLLPHNPDLVALVRVWGDSVVYVRPIIIQILGGMLAFIAARSVDLAIRRADRAEEIAAMEHQLADQKRQLDIGIRQILETHVRVANGDFNARAPLTQDNVLFQIAASLNNLLNRLGRAGQSEYLYQRTVAEIARLRDSLQAAKSGRAPLWPAPSGTPVDELLQIIIGPVRGAPGLSGQLPPTGTSAPSSGPWSAPAPSSPPWAMAAPAPSSGPWGTSGDFWPPQTSPALPDMSGGSNLQGLAPNTSGWGADASHPSLQPAPSPQQSPQAANPWEVPPLSDWPPPGESNTRG
jgi:hypothetical protein